ncbi:GntR family transcriptional regulator [Falsiruegeria mediterranea]|uniref:HTH-type transcriptional repressor RspR n=1 Tax=Falsiruegeria mediterranea M17 TaxID=1200281 RepID=A0A2R8C986_9RHOB|nr:GntR family transcriptional regulator [Falsiruegeria mediterranea]SPJ28916.1 HTH-type transcriptional repressor RspR [Falsiruegeria mediterranea M17]
MAKPPPTVGSSTFERIKRDIIFGTLAPGSKLKLDDLKTRYSASVSTLRETLNRLASDGFVTAEEQRGFFVTPVSKEDLREIASLRILLERHAIRLSIANGDTDWEGDVVAAHHKLQRMELQMQSGDETEKETWKRYDWEFHLSLIRACNSQNLLSLHSKIYDKYLRYQMLVFTFRGEAAAAEHQGMLDAALSRDPDTAIRFLEEHIDNGLVHTLEAM